MQRAPWEVSGSRCTPLYMLTPTVYSCPMAFPGWGLSASGSSGSFTARFSVSSLASWFEGLFPKWYMVSCHHTNTQDSGSRDEAGKEIVFRSLPTPSCPLLMLCPGQVTQTPVSSGSSTRRLAVSL